MELRRVLFDRDIKQATVVSEAARLGFKIDRAWLSRIVNGSHRGYPRQRLAIRQALLRLNVPATVVTGIEELKEPSA